MQSVGRKSEEFLDAILKVFDEITLDVNTCRGQSYVNASNMAVVYSGVQAGIKELSPRADTSYLVGSCAADHA